MAVTAAGHTDSRSGPDDLFCSQHSDMFFHMRMVSMILIQHVKGNRRVLGTFIRALSDCTMECRGRRIGWFMTCWGAEVHRVVISAEAEFGQVCIAILNPVGHWAPCWVLATYCAHVGASPGI